MIEAVLFDFDGVIVDSHRATIEYFQETLQHFGYPVPRAVDFEPLLGLKTIDITRSLLPGESEEQIATVFEFSKQKSLEAVPKITLFPSAKETLEILKAKYQLGLVTSRAKRTVEILFEKYKLTQYFGVVIDREDITKHKPDPEGVNIALKKLSVSSDKAVYIGDSKEDVETAHNANMRCILIPRSDEDFKPDYQITTVSELPELLAKIGR